MLKVLVEGWISYPHSYSLVNVYQILSLIKKDNVKIYLHEAPPYREEWKPIDVTNVLITCEEAELLRNLERWDGSQEVDIVYRITYPYNVRQMLDVGETNGKRVPLVVFYTSEFQSFQNRYFADGSKKSFVEHCFAGKILPVTPSTWSANALRKHKFDPLVIPHGVDVTKFYPIANRDQIRQEWRENYGIPEDACVFLNVGAMTPNKNVKLILKSFYKLTFWRENVWLVLKGIGDLYGCQDHINVALKELKKEGAIQMQHWKRISNRVIFIDELFTYEQLRDAYNSVDCYISPYMAEGFNMPVLEAVACGLSVIVSKGGPTDEFTKEDFAKYPKTYVCSSQPDGEGSSHCYLMVDESSFLEKLLEIVDDPTFAEKALIEGPKHVSEHFTWDIVTEKLYNFLRYATPEIMPSMTSSCHFDLAYTP